MSPRSEMTEVAVCPSNPSPRALVEIILTPIFSHAVVSANISL